MTEDPARPQNAPNTSQHSASGDTPFKNAPMGDGFARAREQGALVLDAAALRAILTPRVCIAALKEAYRDLFGSTQPCDGSTAFAAPDGKFHIKAGFSPRTGRYFSAKTNANFPANPGRGLPTVQGAALLFSGADGRLLAILDSPQLTGARTAAAAALAARYGARRDAKRLAMIGAGAQSKFLIEAMATEFDLDSALIYDTVQSRAHTLATWATRIVPSTAIAPTVADAVREADICVTATTATAALLDAGMLRRGAFVAAVGADNPQKQEIAPALFADARILVDDLDQCAASGDLAHAIRAGACRRENVAANLADLVGGGRQARRSDDDIVLFDSTGTGVQDVAAAAAAYERALDEGAGLFVRLDG